MSDPLYAESPASIHPDQDPPQQVADSIRDLSQPLARRSGWMKFVGIIIIIGAVLNLCSAIFEGIFAGIMASRSGMAFNAGLQAGSTVVNIIVSGIYLWMGILVMQSASAIRRAWQNNDENSLMESLGKLKRLFVIIGVMIIAGFALMILFIIIVVAAQRNGLIPS